MATKTKKPAKKAAPKRRTAKPRAAKSKARPRKSSGVTTELTQHPFPPGTKVGVHLAHVVEAERVLAREPAPKPAATATVTKQGVLKIKLDSGSYSAAAEVNGAIRWFSFAVK